MAVLAILEDLLFRSKLDATATQLGVPLITVAPSASDSSLVTAQPWQVVIVDLDTVAPDAIECITRIRQVLPTVPIVGYGSHVYAERLEAARRAGCTWVGARSRFVQALPGLLTGTFVAPTP